MIKKQWLFIFFSIMILVFSACLSNGDGTASSDDSDSSSDNGDDTSGDDDDTTDTGDDTTDTGDDTTDDGGDTTTAPPPFSTQAFMTAYDTETSGSSNISIMNATGDVLTGYGLYIASVDVNDCSVCFGGVVSGDNAGGTMVQPVSFSVDQSIEVGQNYLYNMIYNDIYYIKNNLGSSPCSLPGCTWPGDDPNVTGWCLTINVMSPDSSYTYSNYVNGANPPASVVPYGDAGSSILFDYKYGLIDPSTLGVGNSCLGPIVCDDQDLTCSVNTPQSQSVQSY